MDLDGLRILVVEDELLVALSIESTLTSMGCTVVGPIPSLAKAMEAATDEVLDGALVDINIKGERSYPVIEILHARGIPTVLCTGYSRGSVLLAPFATLPRIEKPFDPMTLKRTIRRHFGAADRDRGGASISVALRS